MCWYWPLVISRSTQPTAALLTSTMTSRGPSSAAAGGAIGSSDITLSIASGGDSANRATTTRLPDRRAGSIIFSLALRGLQIVEREILLLEDAHAHAILPRQPRRVQSTDGRFDQD